MAGMKKNWETLINSIKKNGVIYSTKVVLKIVKTRIFLPKEFRDIPRTLHVETTNVCNLNCEYCALRTNIEQKSIMKLSQFELLRPYFKYSYSVSLSGLAEPLMNKDIAGMIRCIKNENSQCLVGLVSNATLLTEKMCHELVDAKLDKFEFSLDGIDPSINDDIRIGSNISKIITNISLLNEVKKQKNSKVPVISAATVLQKTNYKQLPKIIDKISDLGIRTLNVNGVEPYTKNILDHILWCPDLVPEDLPDILEEALKLAEGYGITLRLPDLRPTVPSCSAVNSPIILPNGDITPCAVLAYNRASFFKVDENNKVIKEKEKTVKQRLFGNIFEDSLQNIWNKSEYIKFRQNVLSNHFPEECERCLVKHNIICFGGTTTPQTIISQLRELK